MCTANTLLQAVVAYCQLYVAGKELPAHGSEQNGIHDTFSIHFLI